MATLPTFPN